MGMTTIGGAARRSELIRQATMRSASMFRGRVGLVEDRQFGPNRPSADLVRFFSPPEKPC